MSKLIYVLSFVLLLGCSTANKMEKRGVASTDGVGLSGTILGEVRYKSQREVRVGGKDTTRTVTRHHTKKRATRIYFRETKENDGSYNVVLLEYVELIKMGKKYVISNKGPDWLNKLIGYLDEIVARAVLYKAIPTSDRKIFDLQKLRYENGELVAATSANPSKLILDKDPNDNSPLEGARITQSKDGESGEIYFPYTDKDVRKERVKNKKAIDPGLQYNMAQLVYGAIEGFRSTWRTSFLTGNYLGAYNDKKDIVLKLANEGNLDTANFILNKDRAHFSKRRRERQFTNPKSAHITGKYTVEEVDSGIFIFKLDQSVDSTGSKSVDQKIGLFIDIFDASQTKLKQDVVELLILNTDDSKDFLMYYEDPNNGEGN